MANTVSILTYANTFADWVVTTNRLTQENNDLAANNYTKSIGTLYLSDTTLGLSVSANATVGGQFQVQGLGSSAYIQNNFRVDGQTYLTNTVLSLVSSGAINANGINTGLYVANNAWIKGNTFTGTNSYVVGYSYADRHVANTSFTTPIATVTGTLSVTNSALVGTLNANTIVSTPTISVTGDGYANNVYGNTSVFTPLINITNKAFANELQANNSVNTSVLTVSTAAYIENLTANVEVFSPKITVSNDLDGNTAQAWLDTLTINNNLTVDGNFTITGNTVYNSDTFILNSDQITPQNAFIVNNRGNGNANAIIRWNEASDYWDIRDVNNPTISYSKILTANLISDSVISTSSDTVASSKAVNLIKAANDTQNNNISAVNTYAFSAYAQANVSNTVASFAYQRGNSAYIQANAAFSQANVTNTYAFSAYAQANSTNTYAFSAYSQANASNSYANSAYERANASFIQANAAFVQANAANNLAIGAFLRANSVAQNTWVTIRADGVNYTANSNLAILSFTTDSSMEINQVSGNSMQFAVSASGVSANTYGGATKIPVFSVDSTGRITTATEASVVSGATIFNDTANNVTLYPTMAAETSGTLLSAYISDSKLSFNPGTGVLSTTIYSSTSDINLKENVETITNALSTVQKLRGVTYNWRENGQKSMGVIAQELEEVLPELVSTTEQGKTVMYSNMIGLLIEAVKELRAEVDRLKGDNK